MDETPEPASEEVGEGRTKPSPLQRPVVESEDTDAAETTADVVVDARREATQQPSVAGFVDAVQVYDHEPGAIYEVITTPGFVTVLRLRTGEQILHLAAGDTSRWLIDTIDSGAADSWRRCNHHRPRAEPR